MSQRCPYCHDTFDDVSLQTVDCAGCAATHHLECFVECAGCAVFACRTTQAALAGRVLDLGALERGDPGQLGLSPMRDMAVMSFGMAAVVVGAFMGSVLASFTGAAFGAALGLALAWTFARNNPAWEQRELDQVELLRMEMQARGLGIQTEAGTQIPETELLRAMHQHLLTGGPRHDASASPPPTPEHCPHCTRRLRVDSEDEERPWFCYHCGEDLVGPGPLRVKV